MERAGANFECSFLITEKLLEGEWVLFRNSRVMFNFKIVRFSCKSYFLGMEVTDLR